MLVDRLLHEAIAVPARREIEQAADIMVAFD
jgi:hypothetical protein